MCVNRPKIPHPPEEALLTARGMSPKKCLIGNKWGKEVRVAVSTSAGTKRTSN